MARWIVDGMNVIGARPDGWWRDRGAAMAALVDRLERFAEREREQVEVVFDGRERAEVLARSRAVAVSFAPGGPDAADEEIARRVRADREPGEIVVATSDRRLAGSVQQAGAATLGAGELRGRID